MTTWAQGRGQFWPQGPPDGPGPSGFRQEDFFLISPFLLSWSGILWTTLKEDHRHVWLELIWWSIRIFCWWYVQWHSFTRHVIWETSHSTLCTFSERNNRIQKGIPISDVLREEWALVSDSFWSRGTKSQWVMISTAPNCGDKVFWWNDGSPSDLCTRIFVYCLSSFPWETPILI